MYECTMINTCSPDRHTSVKYILIDWNRSQLHLSRHMSKHYNESDVEDDTGLCISASSARSARASPPACSRGRD
jgi:hypothetical protein